jgi:DNA-directed RNA polymerase subunit RPC12/RpoP
MPEPTAVGAKQFKCVRCGARLEFAPGVDALLCPYCGEKNEIAKPTERVKELDFEAALARAEDAAETQEILAVKCRECGAESTLPPDVTSAPCPFCGSALVSTAESRKAVKPGAVLPFKVTREQAQNSFQTWIRKLWFAPNDVRRLARIEGSLAGVYVPYWTYDADTTTRYVGERGEAYYTTETYTQMVNGRMQTQTRQVRHVRWYPASGTVEDAFDDLLVRATNSLPAKYLDALEPWDLPALVPYRDEYLAGFRTDSYQVDLAAGFRTAQETMRGTIEDSCRADIGGDEQRVHDMEVAYRDVKFKHVLFPVWISAFRYRGKIYRLLVNARTGEVQGERPWSWVKITLAVLALPALIGLIALFAK